VGHDIKGVLVVKPTASSVSTERRVKRLTSVIGALCLAVAVSGCSAAAESSGPAPEAFTDCMRHFTDDNLTGPDFAAAGEVCEPFADEANEALQRLAQKHFSDTSS